MMYTIIMNFSQEPECEKKNQKKKNLRFMTRVDRYVYMQTTICIKI